ncbi:hypothetical protein BB561_001491 [Smittium simulii]|uniref:PLD phosphodiesterase domain-containing protein n=1 Tax=Smittium simulii TaxID=133385 RepID=A0A2T9YUD7_9FUNG|nr:hypothetical protein BB561_001491 [Smittium simulii]
MSDPKKRFFQSSSQTNIVHVISDSSSDVSIISPVRFKKKPKTKQNINSRTYHTTQKLNSPISTAIISDKEPSPSKTKKKLKKRIKVEVHINLEYNEAKVLLIAGSHNNNILGSIQIDQLFSCKGNLKPTKALLTTYMMDYEWVREKIGNEAIIVIGCHPPDIKEHTPGAFNLNAETVFVSPQLLPDSRYTSYHPKLMLLWFDGFVRMVISSANLIPGDWESIQNSAFVQDFPLLSKPNENDTVVKSQLIDFLNHSQFPESTLSALQYIDFSSFKHQLVTAVPGRYSKDIKDNKYGYVGLSKSIKNIKQLNNLKMEKLCCQSSSLGFLNLFWINQIIAELGQACQAQILFPTQEQVENSELGPNGAGSVILTERAFNSKYFPRYSLYKPDYTTPGLLSHSKIIYSKYTDSENAWMYLGSANFTKSAWGVFTTKEYKISNFEIGVLLNCYYHKNSIHLYNGTDPKKNYQIPLPFSINWQKYSTQDKPWTLSYD